MLSRHVPYWGAVLLASILLPMFASCSGVSDRFPVEGEVSFDGEPVDVGSIVFMPIAGGGIKTGGQIVDGRYEISAEKGLPLGKHKVLLYWEKKTGETYIDSDSGEVYDKRSEGSPAEYRSEDTPLEIEIVKGQNVHDFNLTTSQTP